jgi:hypothetical protein
LFLDVSFHASVCFRRKIRVAYQRGRSAEIVVMRGRLGTGV